MDDLLSEFLTETSESLAVLDVELVKLEQNPDPTTLQNIFRLLHTIKGTCGFLGLPRLERVAHASEDLLGVLREGRLDVTVEAVTLVLQAIDRIKLILVHLEQNEGEPEGDDGELIEQLKAMSEGHAVSPPRSEPAAAADLVPEHRRLIRHGANSQRASTGWMESSWSCSTSPSYWISSGTADIRRSEKWTGK